MPSNSEKVDRMRSWLRIFLVLSPRLRKVGNPMALLNHVADYTTRELDLRNEISGAAELARIQAEIADEFPTPKLRFPQYYPELSNENVLVSEFIEGTSLEEGIENKSLEWSTLLELFRIHGAYLFGIGTFHGDLHHRKLYYRQRWQIRIYRQRRNLPCTLICESLAV